MPIGTPVAGTLAENASAASSLLVPYPMGLSAGDLILLVVAVSVNTPPTNPTGAGFTSITSGASGTGAQSPAYRASYKVSDGTESGDLTVTMSTATSKGIMWRISGVDTANPVDVVGTPSFTAIGVELTSDGVTTTMAGCQVWAVGVRNSAAVAWDPITAPFTMTEALDDAAPLPATQVSYLTWGGSGATGTVVFDTYSAVRSGGNVFALRAPPPSFVPVPFTGAAAITRRRP